MVEPKQNKGQVLVQLTPGIVERLDERAIVADRSRSWLIEHACKLWLDRLDRDAERRRLKTLRSK